jgi:hypothetical protein
VASQLFRDYLSGISIGDGYPIGLLTVTGTFDGSPFRLNTTADRSVLSRGQTFYASGFDYTLPERVSEGTQRNAFVLPVADRTIWAALRAQKTELALLLEVVLSTSPDTVELGPFRLVDTNRALDLATQTLTIECSYRNVLRNPRPGKKYTPRAFPGMFARPNFSSLNLP